MVISMKELMLKDEIGNTYLICDNEKYTIYKLINNEKVLPSKDEINSIIKELNIIKTLQNKYGSFDFNQLFTLLNQMIINGELNSQYTLENFIQLLNYSPEYKKKILEEGNKQFELKKIDELKSLIFEYIAEKKNRGLNVLIVVNVKNKVDKDGYYCEIKIEYSDKPVNVNDKIIRIDYNEVIKNNLIKPMLLTIALENKLNRKYVFSSDKNMNTRGDFGLTTNENVAIVMNNVEIEFIKELDFEIDNIYSKSI